MTPCTHNIIGFCQACFNIKHAAIISCTHTWMPFTLESLKGVACDFGYPTHEVGLGIVHTCNICHAIVCSDCFVG